MPDGFINAFVRQAHLRPEAVALERHGRHPATWTYADLLARAARWRTAFGQAGLMRGECVVLMLPAFSLDFVACFYAAAALGGVATPVDAASTNFELNPILGDARPRCVVTTRAVAMRRQLSLRAVAALRAVILSHEMALDEADAMTSTTDAAAVPAAVPSTRGSLPIVDLAELAPQEPQRADDETRLVDPTDNPIIGCHFTYRGVGQAVGALHRHAGYNASVATIGAALPAIAAGTVLLGISPQIGHVLTSNVLVALAHGGRVVLLPALADGGEPGVEAMRTRSTGDAGSDLSASDLADEMALPADGITAAEVAELARHHRADALVVEPGTLHDIAGSARPEAAHDWPTSLVVGTPGLQLTPGLHAIAGQALGCAPMHGYCRAEMLPMIANLTSRPHDGAVGVPLAPETTVAIVDESARALPPGEIGEIMVRGPGVAAGYLRRPQLTARFIRSGQFRTGDLGYLDHDGRVHVTGRRLPIADVDARTIDLTEIESVLLRHPAVFQAKAALRAEPGYGKRLTANVLVKTGKTAPIGELRALCGEHLSAHKMPARIRVISADAAAMHTTAASAA